MDNREKTEFPPLLSVGEAKRLGLCRICRQDASPKVLTMSAKLLDYRRDRLPVIRLNEEDGTVDVMDPLVLEFGREYAHRSCLNLRQLLDDSNGSP